MACIFLFIKGGVALLDLMLIKDHATIIGSTESISYKIGFVIGNIAEVIIYFGLVKIIFQKFIMKKSLNKIKPIETT